MFSQLYFLTKRNFISFIKEPKRVFFTFLSPLLATLIFLLFAQSLFNQETYSQSITAQIYALKTDSSAFALKGDLIKTLDPNKIVDAFIDSTFLAGLLGITTITTALSLCSIMVEDAKNKVLNDLFITPVRGGVVRMSYLGFNFVINTIISLIIMVFLFIYQAFRGTFYYHTDQVFIIIALVILSCLLNSAFFIFVISYVRNTNAFAAMSAGISSVIGFFIGSFIPLTQLPQSLAQVASILPGTQMVNAMKLTILPLNKFDPSIFQKALEFNQSSGLNIETNKLLSIIDLSVSSISFNKLFGIDVSQSVNIIYCASFTLIFIFLNFAVKFKKNSR
ncbi:ABC transporter permease [Mycoplasmopsis ciconiae]|uniref:ABC transporter permease n=1 Tax=Mycoplasmopsis ciconiae TaxID=561067 RepID=A0ABU7MMT6_9BACT|nr:ABC transporter permease [Mycoplasmopsis ciconiae]